MIEISDNNKIILRDRIIGESYEVFYNCASVLAGGPVIETDINTDLTIMNGVYQVVQPSITYTYFHYDDKCMVFDKFSQELYYYWVALNLGQSCNEQYSKLCTIYSEFENLLKDECHDCM